MTNDKRRQAKPAAQELAGSLNDDDKQAARSTFLPVAAILRRIKESSGEDESSSDKAAQALEFISRNLLPSLHKRREEDDEDPAAIAFMSLVPNLLTAAGVDFKPKDYVEDIALSTTATMERISRLILEESEEECILLSTHGYDAYEATRQRAIISEVLESYGPLLAEADLEKLETAPGLMVYSMTLEFPGNGYTLVSRDYTRPGTNHPADSELVLLPPAC